MSLRPTVSAWIDNPLRERMTYLYGTLLAYQSTPRDVREMPWTARRLAIYQAELTALQGGDMTCADRLEALRAAHDAKLHGNA